MLTLYSYPGLFGVADNNPFGLKIFAFLKLCRLPFRHEHVMDTRKAPRGQLPFIVDDGETIGDSDAIIAHLTTRHGLDIDHGLTQQQRDMGLLVNRTLDNLYWVMSYSRWKDPAFWPLFRDALLRTHAEITPEALEAAQQYNFQRYHYQGIGRYDPPAVYEKGLADLQVLARLLPQTGFFFGPKARSIDAALYGFIANVYFYDIDTPLKRFLLTQPHLVKHCQSIHAAVQD
ncbi:glutathione S-transferase family protein [Rhodoligotrophos defluvii]|uniref:glutathione S-transferase C-terminal domain-containing protein n=1 Tax=Rhodoligotrophos defluvii TaxID=2561934 RepID=UPI0010C94BEC|nr:glutathione S-transferase family protein [Rhodoligotrophos defluvii]